MALSEKDRQALRDRAAGLRTELSAHVARHDEAVSAASLEREDAALMAEVKRLEKQVGDAAAQADKAEGSVDDAAAIMQAAAAAQAPATATNNKPQSGLLSADLGSTAGKEGSK